MLATIVDNSLRDRHNPFPSDNLPLATVANLIVQILSRRSPATVEIASGIRIWRASTVVGAASHSAGAGQITDSRQSIDSDQMTRHFNCVATPASGPTIAELSSRIQLFTMELIFHGWHKLRTASSAARVCGSSSRPVSLRQACSTVV